MQWWKRSNRGIAFCFFTLFTFALSGAVIGQTLAGDLDGNNIVDDADVNIWLGGTDAADLNNDNLTDKADFDQFFALIPAHGRQTRQFF